MKSVNVTNERGIIFSKLDLLNCNSHYLIVPCDSAGKESACNAEDLGSIPGLRKSPGEGNRLPTPVFWPGEFHGLQSNRSHRVI